MPHASKILDKFDNNVLSDTEIILQFPLFSSGVPWLQEMISITWSLIKLLVVASSYYFSGSWIWSGYSQLCSTFKPHRFVWQANSFCRLSVIFLVTVYCFYLRILSLRFNLSWKKWKWFSDAHLSVVLNLLIVGYIKRPLIFTSCINSHHFRTSYFARTEV